MGNLLTIKYSKCMKTRDGRNVCLSKCVYKFEDRNINIYSSKDEDADTEGGKFWEAFWNLWNTDSKFKEIVKRYHFSPSQRQTIHPDTGAKVQKWGLQIDNWLPIDESDYVIDPVSGLKHAEVKRAKKFDLCLEEIMPILSRKYPQYLSDAVSSTVDDSEYEISYEVI